MVACTSVRFSMISIMKLISSLQAFLSHLLENNLGFNKGFNSKISIIKNRSRGFRSMENFMSMSYFVCGELPMPFAHIM